MAGEHFGVTLTLQDGYRFAADFGLPGVPPLELDEPPPLGEGRGPNAAQVLAAAVGNCLAASLAYCLRRARLDVLGMDARVEGAMVRNERGRLRLGPLRVTLEARVPPDQHQRMGRCLELFEDFCVVTQSVRAGLDVTVTVAGVESAPTVPR
ncbi:MAG TPA: OsmC family protein [Gemmatimonadales bacterium]|nr:OsmC family protein [Gemmatimonadales bacterium]